MHANSIIAWFTPSRRPAQPIASPSPVCTDAAHVRRAGQGEVALMDAFKSGVRVCGRCLVWRRWEGKHAHPCKPILWTTSRGVGLGSFTKTCVLDTSALTLKKHSALCLRSTHGRLGGLCAAVAFACTANSRPEIAVVLKRGFLC
eukprot:5907841-Pleurochrysis_carterae.AAC.2